MWEMFWIANVAQPSERQIIISESMAKMRAKLGLGNNRGIFTLGKSQNPNLQTLKLPKIKFARLKSTKNQICIGTYFQGTKFSKNPNNWQPYSQKP